MSWKSGLNSNAKKLLIKLPEEQGDDELYSLNRAQIKALLAVGESIGWRTRHLALPSWITNQDDLTKFADDTLRDLLMPVDLCALLENCTDELKQIILDLIGNDEDIKQQIVDMLLNNNQFITNITNISKPFPPAPIIVTDTLGKLWAQCVFIVEFTDLRIRDMFEIIETQFNNVELLTFAEALPFIGTLIDEAQVDVAIDFANYMQEVLKELYEANWTEDPPDGEGNMGTKWVLACALFCMCKDDETITITRIVDAFSSCVEGTGLSLEGVSEIAQTILGINDNNSNIVYVAFTAVWGIAKLASILATNKITANLLAAMLKLAENDANDDYLIYCEDCYEEPQPAVALVNSYPSIYNSTITYVGKVEGNPARDIWTVTSVTAQTNAAYVGFAVRDSSNTCMKLVHIECTAARVEATSPDCAAGYHNHGATHPINLEGIEFAGNTRLPSAPNEGTDGAIWTLHIETV